MSFRQTKQTDEFQIEAVSVGEVTKCQLSFSKLAKGDDDNEVRFDEVRVREGEDSTFEYYFICERYGRMVSLV